jgi:hypothetical protein
MSLLSCIKEKKLMSQKSVFVCLCVVVVEDVHDDEEEE